MAKEPTKMRSTPEWPQEKELPRFKSLGEEEEFWRAHSFADAVEEAGVELVYEPNATRQPRSVVYRVRLSEQEMAALQALGKRRKQAAAVVLRSLLLHAAQLELGPGLTGSAQPGRPGRRKLEGRNKTVRK